MDWRPDPGGHVGICLPRGAGSRRGPRLEGRVRIPREKRYLRGNVCGRHDGGVHDAGPEKIIAAGLEQIPRVSRLAEAIRDMLEWASKNSARQAVLEKVYEKYGRYSGVHTINNVLLVCLGLLCGGMDFEKSVCIAVMGGWDTDCNGATVGSIVGLVNGATNIPKKWTARLKDTVQTGLFSLGTARISELARQTAALV